MNLVSLFIKGFGFEIVGTGFVILGNKRALRLLSACRFGPVECILKGQMLLLSALHDKNRQPNDQTDNGNDGYSHDGVSFHLWV